MIRSALPAALLLCCISGCSIVAPTGIGAGLAHNSGLLVDGHDRLGRAREDSLDLAKGFAYWERPISNRCTWYTELSAGYKWREGGFYTDGSKWVGGAQSVVRFRLRDH